MRLLVTTQVVDKNHAILGFFHRWVEEFSKHCDSVHVICLYEGEHSLPSNVYVHSLGKETGESKLKYLLRFYLYIWRLRAQYDAVFVHMNQIYAVLGTPLWKLWGKKVALWYMHKSVTPTLRIAEKLVGVIFTGSKESFRLPSKKLVITGHGIDTAHFAPLNVQKDIDILTVGRITRSKNLHTLIDIFSHIAQTHLYTLTIVGDTMSDEEEKYEQELHEQVSRFGLRERVRFLGPVTQTGLPALLSRARVFAHVAQNGSLDKSTLEALSCGVPVVTMAPGAASLPLGDWHVEDALDFEKAVIAVLGSDTREKSSKLRSYVDEYHSLTTLVPKLVRTIETL